MTERESAHPVTHPILDGPIMPSTISSVETQLLSFTSEDKTNKEEDNETVIHIMSINIILDKC